MKKIITSIIFTFIIFLFSASYSYATLDNNMIDNMGNKMKNVVNGTENVMENTAKGAKNIVQDSGEKMKNGTQKIENGVANMTNSNGYTAQRTASTTDRTNPVMNTGTWAWIIIGIVAIALIIFFWYYAANTKNNRHHE